MSLHKKSRLFSINIERVIKCFVLFHDIYLHFFLFLRQMGRAAQKNKKILKYMYLQCFFWHFGVLLCPLILLLFQKKSEKCEINCRPSVLRSPTVHRPTPKNVSVLSYPRQKPSLRCIIPKRWSPCPLLLSRIHIKVKFPPLRMAGANFWPNKIHPSCQILTNLALCALLLPAMRKVVKYFKTYILGWFL